METTVKSPALESHDGLVDFDLQLFGGIFEPSTDESIEEAAQPAEAGPALEDDDAAQEETSGDHTEPEEEQVEDEQDDTDDETDEDDPETDEDDEAQAGSKAPSDPQTDWVVPGKFRTTDDLKRAYENSERQLGRLHREVAQLRRQGASQQQVDQQQDKIDGAADDAEKKKQLLREFLEDPIAYNERLKREMLEEQQRAAIQQRKEAEIQLTTAKEGVQIVAGRYQDFDALKTEVERVISEEPVFLKTLEAVRSNPNTSATDYAEVVDAAYQIAKARVATKALEEVREQGRKEATEAARARKSAKATGQSTRRDQAEETYEDRLKREIQEAGGPSSIWGD